ncbi:Peptidyl-tRNA hydrolase [Borrelia miyamotoi]|uniref:Peptidyl-tRNA hydrolase n=1 Tax=Borrelia miyamotoi TaxID=47466 RepID=A0AAP9CFB1_9SPIR|nr:aminoacyl-tRNA hydrolase [Borrelia miyamotoi]AHH04611.1 Peptidyl-tRNA hydrolase [Borrelia miyamotoi FR64b]ATQ14482.1 aminoacyl-tRNA hydrolase [Borrelia miyamotoi]ATQ15667.1 aminoacyl-tRNA hydrolase [Borrelia miyamotoi]ATQ16811.1 aminoacyl-tRNA hydrolase [Borrelia miyamotoi]ATQ18686.1 aminoacyl-tRNA hydrolase [Borrelia miyamotoi]
MNLLIIGLGNPGSNFLHTRHNVGFEFIDKLVVKNGLSFKRVKNYEYSDFNLQSRRVVFVKPLTYVNLIGNIFPSVFARFHMKITNMLVVVDNVDLPLGKCKLRKIGGTSTHNGLRSISDSLGSTKYSRLYIGVGCNNESSLRDFVLSKFSDIELERIKNVFEFLSEEILDVDGFNFEHKVATINSSNF